MGLAAAKKSIFNVTGKGKAKIEMCVNGTNRNITFEDALHIPELCSNLISVSKLAEKGIKVEFDQHDDGGDKSKIANYVSVSFYQRQG